MTDEFSAEPFDHFLQVNGVLLMLSIQLNPAPLIMELVTDRDINLSRIRVMRPSKSIAVVEQKPPVRRIERVDGEREFLAECLAHGQV